VPLELINCKGTFKIVLSPYIALAKNILVSNVKRLDFPYKLTYALTYWCNYRCKTCNIWQKKPVNELSLKEIQQFFRNSNKFSWVDLTGGEVFLRKDFLGIVEAVLSNCQNLLLLHFPTNGYLTDKIVTSVEKIMSWKPQKLIITVSMDGDEAVNDEIRGIKGGWKRQIETFKQLHGIPGVKTVLGMTLSAYNADQIEIAFQAAKRECEWLTYEDFHVNIAHVSGHYYSNEDQDPYQGNQEKLITEIKKYIRHRGMPTNPVSFLEREYLKRVESYLRTGKTPVRCHSLKSSCFLDPFGKVYPCGMYSRVVGDIRESGYDLSRIWNSEKCQKLQKEIWEYRCPQCWTPCEAYQSILGSLLPGK
jgi:MoaA/NifB/PqqE/SkfB family radical SAM enzyme